MMEVPFRIFALIKEVLHELVSGDFAAVEARSRGVRLTANEIRIAIEEYGRTLIMPSEDDLFRLLDIQEITGSSVRAWSVVCPLFTREEGRSDLTLECTVIERGATLNIEIDNVHVL